MDIANIALIFVILVVAAAAVETWLKRIKMN